MAQGHLTRFYLTQHGTHARSTQLKWVSLGEIIIVT